MWKKLKDELPINGQIVFIQLLNKIIYVAKARINRNLIDFYIFEKNIYVDQSQVNAYIEVILPQPPVN